MPTPQTATRQRLTAGLVARGVEVARRGSGLHEPHSSNRPSDPGGGTSAPLLDAVREHHEGVNVAVRPRFASGDGAEEQEAFRILGGDDVRTDRNDQPLGRPWEQEMVLTDRGDARRTPRSVRPLRSSVR